VPSSDPRSRAIRSASNRPGMRLAMVWPRIRRAPAVPRVSLRSPARAAKRRIIAGSVQGVKNAR
jgi:hypothetical protein